MDYAMRYNLEEREKLREQIEWCNLENMVSACKRQVIEDIYRLIEAERKLDEYNQRMKNLKEKESM